MLIRRRSTCVIASARSNVERRPNLNGFLFCSIARFSPLTRPCLHHSATGMLVKEQWGRRRNDIVMAVIGNTWMIPSLIVGTGSIWSLTAPSLKIRNSEYCHDCCLRPRSQRCVCYSDTAHLLALKHQRHLSPIILLLSVLPFITTVSNNISRLFQGLIVASSKLGVCRFHKAYVFPLYAVRIYIWRQLTILI